MKKTVKRSVLLTIIVIGCIYCLDGIVFGFIAGRSQSHTMVVIWRLAAWVTCAFLFAAHIWYEHYQFNNASRKTALYASSAAAIGAFGLSVAANIHGLFVSSANHMLLVLSLVIWPVLTAVPAFIVALVITSVLHRFQK